MIVNGVVINLDDISPPFGTVITETGLTRAGTITANICRYNDDALIVLNYRDIQS